MPNDVKTSRAIFVQLSPADKRKAVIAFLEPIQNLNETFRTVYQYVLTYEAVEESTLDDIYRILTDACLEIEGADQEASMKRLSSIGETIRVAHEIENQERVKDTAEADNLFSVL